MSHYLCRSLPFSLRRLTLQCVLNDSHFYLPSFVLSSRNSSRFLGRGSPGGDNGGDRRRVSDRKKTKQKKFSELNGDVSLDRGSTGSISQNVHTLFKPVIVQPSPDDISLGEEIAGSINKQALLKQLNQFFQSKEIKALCKEQGLDDYLYHQAYISFRKFCMDVKHLPTDLYVLFADLLHNSRNVTDILPYFITHAKKVFPHLECLEDLRQISDLTNPSNWYPEARSMNRKIIFHAGPTNSGKTYHALERYMSCKSGVYCGPLKMLAVEVFNKSNIRGTPCDLVTGEERKWASADGEPSNHISCTVEMTNISQTYEVAVIDEIQMVKDYQRGWAWTRALLGVPAEEVHVCGEAAAIDLVREIALSTGEELEVRHYKRLTDLIVMDSALDSLHNIEPGDCIVCFNKQDIYAVSRSLEKLGIDCAVIYGSLPPGTKLAMAQRFNDPNDPCKVLVATDAIGMGLNLNIRRIIFNSVTKIQLTENGEKEMNVISVSQALQIAGRAGRFGTQWETGYVTCFNKEELGILKDLLKSSPNDILQAGLHPTFDQIETYAYHLPHASLANLVDIFISLSVLDDSMYSLCHLDDFKFLADMIEHIKLPLKAKYTFCCAPINRRMPFVCTMFLKISRQFSRGELITFNWLCHQVGWPFSPPDTILDLVHLESVHDVFDLYLWLSYRFQDMFPDVELVRSVQQELDKVIEEGVANIVQLLRSSESPGSSNDSKLDEDAFEARNRQQNKFKRWNHTTTTPATGSSHLELEPPSTFTSFANSASFENVSDSLTLQSNQTSLQKPMSKKKVPRSKKLTEQLIAQGLLTKAMLEDLKREWKDE